MKILITGANGFIGSKLTEKLLNYNHNIVAIIGNKTPFKITHPNLEVISYNLIDDFSLLHKKLVKHRIDTIIHLAWLGTSGINRNNYSFQEQNIRIIEKILLLAKELNIKKFIGAGTIMEFEVQKSIFTDVSPNLSYIYGSIKLLAHSLSKILANNFGIIHIWPIFTNAFGPGETSPRFINSTLRKIINGEELNFSSGTQNYDFIYIDDLINAIKNLLTEGKNNFSYVIGSGSPKPLKQFINEILDLTQYKGSFNFGTHPFQGVNLDLQDFDISNLINHTGYTRVYSFKEGISKTYEWIKSNK
jgi:UDP-glucose 4-epimerase